MQLEGIDMDALLRHQLSDDVERIEVPVEKVVFVVGNLKRMVKCGFHKMRHEHLKDLFGKTFRANPEEAEFRTIYTKLINRLINGEMPATVLPLFRDIEVVAIPKKGNDIRPKFRLLYCLHYTYIYIFISIQFIIFIVSS